MAKSIIELLSSSKYDQCKTWIYKARENNKTWDEINYACKQDENGLRKFLASRQDEDFWIINSEEWHLLVNEIKKIEEKSGSGFIGDPKKDLKGIPSNPGSCWVKYKDKLYKNNFTPLSVSNIEKSAQKIISQLEESTVYNNPVRGMVVGNVQSGKTANMSGVIAMAADYGFNFFIVLTGTIDNLRIQTRKRLISDLTYENCNVHFEYLDYLSAGTQFPERLQDLKLGGQNRYLTVCLKNSKRLQDLLNWLNLNKASKGSLKVLLIDDEADQAGVNTKSIS